MDNCKKFNKFLAGIDLDSLRTKYRHIKIVELDMPKSVQALACLYREYWKKRKNWPEYEAFYRIYRESLSQELEAWRKSCMFSKETFYRDLPARIYRTWASLLTQIQGAYVAEELYGKGNVEMSVSADYRGKDLVIDLGKNYGRIPVQIKKKSNRPEAQRKTSAAETFIKVVYSVPPGGPLTRTGKPSKPFRNWQEEWGDRLERLDNGFIVFKPKMFKLNQLLKGIIE